MNNDYSNSMDKTVTIAGLINILGLISIILSIFGFDPLTFITSITLGAIFIAVSCITYLYVVIIDMKNKGVL